MRKIKYSKELLESLAKDSVSIQQVMRKLGLKLSGGTHSHLKRKFDIFNIDISHFTGRASNQGITHKGGYDKLNVNNIFVLDRLGGRREKARVLRRVLIESGIEEKCEQCGVEKMWNNKPITLHVDHRDGNGLNNIKENLRFLCPNCHSQTDNFGVKNIKD